MATTYKKQLGPSLTSVLLAAEAQSARIIGITSERAGAGVSLAAESLAKTYANFGRRALLIAVGHDTTAQERPAPNAALQNKRASSLAGLDLATLSAFPMEHDPHVYRRILEAGGQDYAVVIVDLPPVSAKSNRAPAEILAPVAACDLVFLVGLTGEADRDSVSACVEMCRIGGVKLGGWIMNDWRMPLSKLLMLDTRRKTAAEPTAVTDFQA